METTINIFQHSSDFKEFKQGETIFSQGDVGDVMYVVQEGTVDIVRDGVSIDTVQMGQVFGEIALLKKAPRSASAIAKTDCKLVPVDARRFLFLIDNNRQFALAIMRALCERLIAADARLTAALQENSIVSETPSA